MQIVKNTVVDGTYDTFIAIVSKVIVVFYFYCAYSFFVFLTGVFVSVFMWLLDITLHKKSFFIFLTTPVDYVC